MSHPKFKIIGRESDDDSNVVDVDTSSNALHVKLVESIDSIDIGDVSLLLGGTAASVNDGAADATTLRVTVANDSDGLISVDDNGGSLTVDGSVAVTSILPGTSALNLGKQEDNAHSSGDVGVQMLAVRTASPADKSNADGDYEPLQMDEGRLWSSTLVTQNVNPDGMGGLNSYGRFDATYSGTATVLTDSINGINSTETSAKEVIIQCPPSNTGHIRVGDIETVQSNNGIRVDAGDTLILPIADISNIYIDASAASQKVFVTIVK